jgi:hypothetical protein
MHLYSALSLEGTHCISACGRVFTMAMLTAVAMQAQSAKLIGEAVQQNPAFLMLRRIEV